MGLLWYLNDIRYGRAKGESFFTYVPIASQIVKITIYI